MLRTEKQIRQRIAHLNHMISIYEADIVRAERIADRHTIGQAEYLRDVSLGELYALKWVLKEEE